MGPVGDELLLGYRAVLAPFLMLSSCATLVWSLQSRYSRIVQSIRDLSAEWREAPPGPERGALRHQLDLLRARARWRRNGVVGYYVAMVCFLLAAIFLAAALNAPAPFAAPTVVAFVAGLLVVCWTLVSNLVDAVKAFDAIAEEVTLRGPAALDRAGREGPRPD